MYLPKKELIKSMNPYSINNSDTRRKGKRLGSRLSFQSEIEKIID